MNNLSYWVPFKHLLGMDLYLFRRLMIDKVINLVIWVVSAALISTYLLPLFGMSHDYGQFLLIGLCASVGLFEVFPSVAKLVDDLKGDQIILYQMTLPLPACLVILRMMLYSAASSLALSVLVLPLGKLLLQNHFDLSNINFIKLTVIFVLSSLFYGSYGIFIATRVKDMTQIGNVWMRFVYPLWCLGGYQFSWYALKTVSPAIAYINLANPILYIMEGTRAAVLGQEGYINFWASAGMLALFCAISIYAGIVLLKKRLDLL